MDFVHYIHLILAVDGRKSGFFNNITDIIDAVVACGVKFDKVDRVCIAAVVAI